MVILVVVPSFPGFWEDLLWVETFTKGVPAMKIALVTSTTTNIITIMEEEDLAVVDTIMEEEEDLAVDMVVVDITN
jgi:hypothetical protein